MTTKVEKSILVNVPVSAAYNQWTQFEDFPQFMGGIISVTQLSDARLEWVAQIAGVRRTWEAKILEQIPDQKIAWSATEGATNAGAVSFEDLGGGQTSVRLSLEYEPEGLVETVGDKLKVIANQVEGDLDWFKAFIEAEGYAAGAWRWTVAEPASVIPQSTMSTVGGIKARRGIRKCARVRSRRRWRGSASAVTPGCSNDDKKDVKVPAKTVEVGAPLAAQSTDIEPQSGYRPGDTAVTPKVDKPAGGSNADLRSAEPTGLRHTDLGSPRTDPDNR